VTYILALAACWLMLAAFVAWAHYAARKRDRENRLRRGRLVAYSGSIWRSR
jgi:hypothetical protein